MPYLKFEKKKLKIKYFQSISLISQILQPKSGFIIGWYYEI